MLIYELPDDIIRVITEYLDNINYRNGKYILRIPTTDKRYILCQNIKPPVFFNHNIEQHIFKYSIWLKYKNSNGCVLYYDIDNNNNVFTIELINYTVGKVRGSWRQLPGQHKKLYTISKDGTLEPLIENIVMF
jgi:hypothetical protein